MRETAILRALRELDRWRSRRDELRARRETPRAELDAVERQVAYYQALAEDMKREVRPARTRDLLSAIFR